MKTENEKVIELSRTFPVSVEELYKAWISPEALKQWWTPMGKKLAGVKNEVEKGGSIEYSAKDSDTPLVITGEYKEVKENERLVYDWNFNFTEETLDESPYRLTVEFGDDKDGSRLRVKQENLEDDEAVKVHQKGWEQQLENLEDYLSEQNS